MIFRSVNYLIETVEFKNIIKKYNLLFRVFNYQKVQLVSNCFVLEIYAFTVESIFYFDLYSRDLKLYSNLDRILSEFDSEKIMTIYNSNLKRDKILIPILQANSENTLKAEQFFFTYIQLIDEILEEFFLCKKKIPLEYYSVNPENKEMELKKELASMM